MPDLYAWVAKLVDAPDSKSGSLTGVSVRVRPQVPLQRNEKQKEFLGITFRGDITDRN